MRYDDYSRRKARRYKVNQPVPIRIKLIEQFLGQLIVCSTIIIIIVGSQLLGFNQVSKAMYKMKEIITYAPSLGEITQNTKNTIVIIRDNINLKDKDNKSYQEEEETPLIIIDEDIF